jgi:hypothetical protein
VPDLPDWRDTDKIYDSLRRLREFTVTGDHLKLLRHMQVCWLRMELTGAPVIQNKRPYGMNSAVAEDVAQILQAPDSDYQRTEDGSKGYLRPEAWERYLRLHVETAVALQIALATGEFRAGRYKRTGPAWRAEWACDEPAGTG